MIIDSPAFVNAIGFSRFDGIDIGGEEKKLPAVLSIFFGRMLSFGLIGLDIQYNLAERPGAAENRVK